MLQGITTAVGELAVKHGGGGGPLRVSKIGLIAGNFSMGP